MLNKLLRWLLLIFILCFAIFSYTNGWHHLITLELVGRNYSLLKSYVDNYYAFSLFIYVIFYIVIVILCLPAGFVFTVSGGLLFGWLIGAPAAVFSATLGATLLFQISKSSLGQLFFKNVSPSLKQLREGFNKNALSYMLFLRLVPIFPFFVVNLAPAFLDVPLKTFVLGTLLGIIPATFAFSYAGSSLGHFVEAQNFAHAICLTRQKTESDLACPYHIDTSLLFTRELFFALISIGFVALLPIIIRRFKIF